MQISSLSIDHKPSLTGRNLTLIIALRWVAITIQLLAIALATIWLQIDLPAIQMLMIVMVLGIINARSSFQLRRDGDLTEAAILRGFVIDTVGLFCLLYLSGGVNNPFISLFLVQVIVASVLLRDRNIWFLVALTTIAYIALVFFYQPLELPHRHGSGLYDMHLQGMFISHVIAAVLVAVFLSQFHRNAIAKDRLISAMQIRAAEEERIVRMGLLASSAAHDLGTPLMTMDVLLSDWQGSPLIKQNPDLLQDVEDMRAQIVRCRDAVTTILSSSGSPRAAITRHNNLRDFMDDVVMEWKRSKRDAGIDYANLLDPGSSVVSDGTLRTIVRTLLDNAYDASSHWIGVAVGQINRNLTISISDAGAGFTPKALSQLGNPFVTTKPGAARGMGLFLVSRVVQDLGGYIEARNGTFGGASVKISIPVANLEK